jgi:hypothetical protein
MVLVWRIAFMWREVACTLRVLSWNLSISNIPIEGHITMESLHQEIVKKMAKVIVVRFFIEGEQAAVLKEQAKL